MPSCNSGQEGRREVFDTLADFLKHFVNDRRLELLEILAQGESSVDRLSELSGMAITTTSNNLQRLKEAGLVNTRREGTRIFYRLSGDDVLELFIAAKKVALRHSPTLASSLSHYLDSPDVSGPTIPIKSVSGDTVGAVGLVISLHIAGMWLPSLVTGMMVDKIGARLTAISSGVVLLISGLIAAFTPNDNLSGLILALVLLGVGWNLGLISGTTLVVQGTAPATRSATQGSIDVWVNIFGAGAGIFSGIMMSASGFAALSIAGGILALIIVPALWLAPRKPVAV